jgi:hypothetical protein
MKEEPIQLAVSAFFVSTTTGWFSGLHFGLASLCCDRH